MKNYILKVAIIIAVFFGMNVNLYSINKEKIGPIASKKLVCQIITADLGGAWAGSWAGGKVGGLFMNPAAVGIGASAGAVIFGAISSYGASKIILVDPPQIDIINSIDISLLNPKELNTGYRHNVILKELIISNNNKANNDIIELIKSTNLTKAEREFVVNNELEIRTVYSSNLSVNSIDNVKEILTEKIQNAKILTIMFQFIEAFDKALEFSDKLNTINQFEKDIYDSDNYSDNEKHILLDGLSVAKYSLNFWNNLN